MTPAMFRGGFDLSSTGFLCGGSGEPSTTTLGGSGRFVSFRTAAVSSVFVTAAGTGCRTVWQAASRAKINIGK